jgi:ATP-dependent Clp protease ATP-binding subunit ClpX
MEKKEEVKKCSFCGRTEDEVNLMFNGNNAYICDACAEYVHSVIAHVQEQFVKEEKKEDELQIKTPHEIKEFLDDYVIGQDMAKIRLAVAVYNHYKRITQTVEDDNIEIEKSNCLLLGKTGTGKTMLARTIAKMLNVPFTIVDATVLTEAGYVGEDVESIISRLLQAADYNVERAEHGIIFIDEIDKISRKSDNPSITRDVSGEGVQQGLLKLLEGSKVLVAPEGGRKHPDQKMVEVDTTNILFICGGAFEGIERKIAMRLNRHAVGFTEQLKREQIKDENMLKYITPADLRSFGLIPEIIGRLPVITYLDDLDAEALKRILIEPKNAIIKQYIKLFKIDGITLHIDEDVYQYIVDKAIENKLGARGLRGITENIMTQAMFDMPSKKVKEFTITLDYAKKELAKYNLEEETTTNTLVA